MENLAEKNIAFDFYGREADKKKKADLQVKKEKLTKFKKMGMIACGSALAMTLTGWGGVEIYERIQKSTDEAIAQKEAFVKSTPSTPILEMMERERDVVKTTFNKNKVAIASYANYKELIQALNLNTSVGSKIKNNNDLQVASLDGLNKDQKSLENVVNALSGSRDVKKDVLLSGKDIEQFTKWSSNVKNNQFMYAGGIIRLGKDIDKELELLSTTQKDIVSSIETKIKNKDFNLDATQSKLISKVATDTESDLNELRKIRNEVADTDQRDLLTDRDIRQAESAVNDLRSEAANKIAQDKQKVENMVTQVNTQGTHNSWGMTEYLLLYSWLNSNNNNNNNYQAGYNAGQNQASAMLARNSSDMYNIRQPNSYLNQGMDSRFNNSAVQRPSINAIRSQMETARNRARQASIARQESIERRAEMARRAESDRRAEISRQEDRQRSAEMQRRADSQRASEAKTSDTRASRSYEPAKVEVRRDDSRKSELASANAQRESLSKSSSSSSSSSMSSTRSSGGSSSMSSSRPSSSGSSSGSRSSPSSSKR